MKTLAALFVSALVGCPWTAAYAAPRTVTLSVPGMTCAACPFTVKKALSRVDGVIEAKVNWQPKEAVVTYDDAETDVEALTRATANAGYPSTVKP